MSIAFVYPGQGSQYVGMGKDLYKETKEIFDSADNILGFDLSRICFEGPEEELKQTYITQPAIFVHSAAVTSLIREKIRADAVAGHSLGEYSALVYAGALTFEDGLRLVKIRGEEMQKAGERSRGTMAAVVGLEYPVVEQICDEASAAGIVQAANINSPGQIVISGSVEGVKQAMELAKQRKAKLVKELVVHGAFHSALMEPAAGELKKALNSTEFHKVSVPVYKNVDAKPLTPLSDVQEIRDSLLRQLTSPVRWQQTIENMISQGTGEFIEVGPGKVLQGLIKRIDGKMELKGFDRADDIRSIG